MGNGEFKVHKGIIPILENFDFDITCNVQGFELVRVPKKGDVQRVVNQGGKYGAQAKNLVNQCQHGDTYYYNNIKVKCPGDPAARELNGMIFNIR